MKAQKFKRGDLVRIAKDLGASMAHFEADQDAIVMGSYRDLCGSGPNNTKEYEVLLCKNGDSHSWYYERQLTFIKHVGEDAITALKDKYNTW
mgnify:CR=1 FL=1